MATVGQELPTLEIGWKRYDDTDVNITYSNNFLAKVDMGWYNNTISYTSNENGYVRFNFVGNRLRIIGQHYPEFFSSNIKIKIDGRLETFSQVSPVLGNMLISYEKLNLSNSEHSVEIYTDDDLGFNIDAIDIDDTGELKPYNQILIKEKHFLKSNNKIYTLNKVTNTLEDITSSLADVNNITKLEYETYGFNDLSKVSSSQLNSLVKPISVLYYRDNIDNTTETPRLRQEYNLNVGVRQMIKKPVV